MVTEISTWGDLENIILDTAGSYKLVNDLDSDTSGYSSLAEDWRPIAGGFSGTLDGNGYVIDGMTVDGDFSLYGLFEDLQGATIKNLTVKNATVIAGTENAGILAGETTDECTIEKCTFTGLVDSGGEAGLIAGNLGGIAGGTVKNVDVAGTVRGYRCGLIAGTSLSEIIECTATGTVEGQNADTNTPKIGGMVGYNQNNIKRCLCDADVTHINDTNYKYEAGGLVGYHDAATISQSRALGKVSVAGSLGGIAGNSFDNIETSYTTAEINGLQGALGDAPKEGGITGTIENNRIADSTYWDTEATTVSVSDSGDSAVGTPLTTSEMQGDSASSNMGLLDFESIWRTVPDSYPELEAHYTSPTVTVNGTINDAQGNPVPNDVVEVVGVGYIQADENGSFKTTLKQEDTITALKGAVSRQAASTMTFEYGGIEVIVTNPYDGEPLEDTAVKIGRYWFETDAEGKVVNPLIPPGQETDVTVFDRTLSATPNEGQIVTVDMADHPDWPDPQDLADNERLVTIQTADGEPVADLPVEAAPTGSPTRSDETGTAVVTVPNDSNQLLIGAGNPLLRTHRIPIPDVPVRAEITVETLTR